MTRPSLSSNARPPPCTYCVYLSCHQTCVSGDAGLLSLTATATPGDTFFPNLLEGDLLLTLEPSAAGSGTTSTVGSSRSSSSAAEAAAHGVDAVVGTDGGVVWNVNGFVLSSQQEEMEEGMMEWTVFPAAGLLLPGQRCAR